MATTDQARLEALNREYIRSVSEADVRWFDANLSEDFVNSNPDCSRLDREGFLAQIGRGSTVKGLDIEDPRAGRRGPDPRPDHLREGGRAAGRGPLHRRVGPARRPLGVRGRERHAPLRRRTAAAVRDPA
jgi:hypothetical protein